MGPHWYVLALFGAPILLLLVGVAIRSGNAIVPMGRYAADIPANYLLTLLVIAILISVWEEGGWMAFVTVRLQRRWGPFWPASPSRHSLGLRTSCSSWLQGD